MKPLRVVDPAKLQLREAVTLSLDGFDVGDAQWPEDEMFRRERLRQLGEIARQTWVDGHEGERSTWNRGSQ